MRKASQLSKIIADDKVFELVDMIENQYIIRLVKSSKSIIVNRVIFLTIEIKHTCIRYLECKFLLELLKLVFGIDIKGPALTQICSRYMKGRLQ